MGWLDGVSGMSPADFGVCLPEEEQVSYPEPPKVSEPEPNMSYAEDQVKAPPPVKTKAAHRFVDDGFGGVSDTEKGVSLPGPSARIQTEKATGLMRKQSESWAANHPIERQGQDMWEAAAFPGLLLPMNKRVAEQQAELKRLFAEYDQLIESGDFPAADKKLADIQSRLDSFQVECGKLNRQADEAVATFRRGYALDAPKEVIAEVKGNAQGGFIKEWYDNNNPVDSSDGYGVRFAAWVVDDVFTDHRDDWRAQQKEMEDMHRDVLAKARRGENAAALKAWQDLEAKIEVNRGKSAEMRDESVAVAEKTVKGLETVRDTAVAVEAGLATGGFGGWAAKGAHWAVRGYVGLHAAVPTAMAMRGTGDALGAAFAGGDAQEVATAGTKGSVEGAKIGVISGVSAVVTGGIVEKLAKAGIPWVSSWFHGVEHSVHAGNASATEIGVHTAVEHGVHKALPH